EALRAQGSLGRADGRAAVHPDDGGVHGPHHEGAGLAVQPAGPQGPQGQELLWHGPGHAAGTGERGFLDPGHSRHRNPQNGRAADRRRGDPVTPALTPGRAAGKDLPAVCVHPTTGFRMNLSFREKLTMRLIAKWSLCLAVLAAPLGCQKIDVEKTYQIGAGVVEVMEISAPTYSQDITVTASSSGGVAFSVYVVLEDNAEAVKNSLMNYKEPDKDKILASKEKA